MRRLIVAFLSFWIVSAGATLANGQTARWSSPESGRWADPEKWDSGEAPVGDAQDQDVLIDRDSEGLYVVEYDAPSSPETTLGSLELSGENSVLSLGFFNGDLSVVRRMDFLGGLLRIRGSATLSAETINFGGSDLELIQGNRLDVVSGEVTGNLDFRGVMSLQNEAKLVNARAVLRGDDAILRFNNRDGVVEDSSIVLLDSSMLVHKGSLDVGEFNAALTIGSGSIVTGSGQVGGTGQGNLFIEGSIFANRAGKELELVTGDPIRSSVVNRGIIGAHSGATLSYGGANPTSAPVGKFTNDTTGRIVVRDSSEVQLAGDWENRGRIRVENGGTLRLQGEFATNEIGNIVVQDQGKVVIEPQSFFSSSVWDNEGSFFDLGDRADNFLLNSVVIEGGTIRSTVSSPQFDRLFLSSVRYVGDIHVPQESVLILNSANVAGSVFADDSVIAVWESSPTRVPHINLSNSTLDFNVGSFQSLEDVKLNSGQLVEGSGTIEVNRGGQDFRSFGTISANIEGEQLAVVGGARSEDVLINRGLMEARNGGELRVSVIDGLFRNLSDGVIRVHEDSTLVVDGALDNRGAIELLDNSELRFTGTRVLEEFEGRTFDGISSAETAKVVFDAEMTLGSDQLFRPADFFDALGPNSDISGGSVDLRGVDSVSGRFSKTTFRDELVFPEGSNVSFGIGVTLPENNVIRVNGSDSSLFAPSLSEDALVILGSGASHIFGNELAERVRGNGTIQGSSTFSPLLAGAIRANSANERIAIFSDFSSSFRNDGVVAAANGGVIESNIIFWQTGQGASVRLDDGIILAPSLAFSGGRVSGNGIIEGLAEGDEPNTVLRGATLSPGLEIGQLDVIGGLGVGLTSGDRQNRLVFDIGGTIQGAEDGYDFLRIEGDLDLAYSAAGEEENSGNARLIVRAEDELSIDDLAGIDFTIIDLIGESTELTGLFSNVANGEFLSTFDDRFLFQVHYGAESQFGSQSVVLNNFRSLQQGSDGVFSVPEPSGVVVLLFLGVGLMSRRSRK